MPAPHLPIADWWSDHRGDLTALGTVVVAVLLAVLADRALARRGARLAAAVAGGQLTPVATTRLRLLRRLTVAGILVLGVALAAVQFGAVQRAAAGVLASSALLGLVVGFAARQTLANAVAGVLLAITQPVRIGDLVTFEGETGVVDDVRLTYTYLRADDGRTIVIPNERLAQSTIQNHTLADPSIEVEVVLWLPPEAELARALQALEEESGGEAVVSGVDKDGISIAVRTRAPAAERRATATRIRAACLERLQREALSSETAS